MKASVGVFGATGYSGREAVRLLRSHAHAEVGFTSGSGDGYVPHEQAIARKADAYLLSLPHGISARYVAQLRQAHPQAAIVDLSGDLRLKTAAEYQAWYGQPHPAPELLGVPYGLTEIFRERIRSARIVSNPGCYATSALLALLPLLRDKLASPEDVIVDAKSGASGAGRTPREELLFCELSDDFSAYSPGRTHRHVGEMEAAIEEGTGLAVKLAFCPHLLPVKRGILSAVYLRTSASASDLRRALSRCYENEPFVKVGDGKPPKLSEVVLTNECRLSVHEAGPGRVVIFSALDNLVKGAAGQAIQNLNLMMGWEETAGLR